jgi:hypothetical protein
LVVVASHVEIENLSPVVFEREALVSIAKVDRDIDREGLPQRERCEEVAAGIGEGRTGICIDPEGLAGGVDVAGPRRRIAEKIAGEVCDAVVVVIRQVPGVEGARGAAVGSVRPTAP